MQKHRHLAPCKILYDGVIEFFLRFQDFVVAPSWSLCVYVTTGRILRLNVSFWVLLSEVLQLQVNKLKVLLNKLNNVLSVFDDHSNIG